MSIFKIIPQLPHLEISDCGSIVRKVACKTEIAISTNGQGYKVFRPGDGVNAPQYVHRAVLSAHAREPQAREITRHLNDDRADNSIENLKWGTHSENHADAVRNGRRGHRTPKPSGRRAAPGMPSVLSAFHSEDDIRDIRRAFHLAGLSQSQIARNYGVSQTTICQIVHFKSYAKIVSEAEVEAFRPEVK